MRGPGGRCGGLKAPSLGRDRFALNCRLLGYYIVFERIIAASTLTHDWIGAWVLSWGLPEEDVHARIALLQRVQRQKDAEH